MNFSGDYPDNWKEIAEAAKAAVNYRCVRCGHRHSPPSDPQPCDRHCDPDRHPGGLNDGRQRVLTIHHADGDKGNSQWWNLLPLCQVCHLAIQAKVNLERPWLMFDHSDWFRPYVAGYYAFKYMGLQLERPEVDASLDYLLSLEREAYGWVMA